ncbi:MAG: hypothetical protein ACD_41C00354G0004 [uncultured bacterium]|nr:MAG: hypothetical protein ACD_41C00354G0004 [uncultured bacterium]HBY74210.1 hypothetical protein [Candidatus Kerfeldbacteria bacterium]
MRQIKTAVKKLFILPVRSLALISVAVFVSFSVALPVQASWFDSGIEKVRDVVLTLLSWLLYYLGIVLYGWLATMATKLLVYVAQLNNFTDLPVIIEAWSVVRDLANMFFIVILLVIAFGTLFRIEAYSWKKLLPKMVLAAILVNYSRAICGFIVDASQVVMLTFVAAIEDAATVGMVEAFQLNKILQFESKLDPTTGTEVQGSTERFVALLAAGGMLVTMFIVQMVYVVVLVGRLVMIWFLTVLSPLAFASSVLPQTEKFSSQWWEMFTRYVIVGPLCMFFLWLGMFIAAKSVDSGGLGSVAATEAVQDIAVKDAQAGGAGALNTTLIAGFVIATMMLMAGMQMAQQNASELGGAISKVQGISKFALKAAPVVAGVIGGAAIANRADRLYQATGYDLNMRRNWDRIKHKREDIKRKRVVEGYTKAFSGAQKGNFVKGWLGASDFAYEQYTPVMGKQGVWGKGTRGMLTRWRGNQKFKEAGAEIGVMEDQASKTEKELKETKSTLQNEWTTVEDRDRRVKENKASQQAVAGASNNGSGWNMTTGSETATMAQNLLTQLQEERSKTTDVNQARKLTEEIDALKEATNQDGEVNIRLAGNLESKLGKAKRDRYKELMGEGTDLKGLKVKASQEELDNFIKAETGGQQAALDKMKGAIRDKKKEVADHYAPVIDYEGSQATEEALALERKKYAGEENEDVLKELLQAKLHEKDGAAALGVIQQAASVGHLNEMMDAVGLSENFDGMQELAKMIQEKTGVGEQMVLAAFDQASKSAKHINHWAYAEAVTQRNGSYQWRGDEEHRERRYVEMSKAGMSNIARSGNRLAYGGYKMVNGEQQWEPDPAAMALLVQQLPRLVDTAKKGMLNNSAGEHFFTKNSGKYGKELEALVDATFGAASTQAREAKEAIKYWKDATSAQNRVEGDLYGIAEKVAAEHRKAA